MRASRACLLFLCTAQAALAQQLSTGKGDRRIGLYVTPITPPQSQQPRIVGMDGILPASLPVSLQPVPAGVKAAESFIRCKLALSVVLMPKVRLALVPLHGEASDQLVRLQMTYARIKLEVAHETAPRQLIGPMVRGPPGYRREVDIERSAADIARAGTSADVRARQAFERFQNCEKARITTLLKQDEFTFHDLPPGLFAICVIAEVRSATDARTFRTRPRIWWATVALQDGESASVLFEQHQGRDWCELFPP